MSNSHAWLTIGGLSTATGVSADTLRAWESRHGFPAPVRLPSGHRRYTAAQVDQVRQVLDDRKVGMSLDAAVARLHVRDDAVEPSIFAGLRRHRPELPVHVISKRAMLALSRARSRTSAAPAAARPLLIGCFQQVRFFRQSEARWRDLTRTAATAMVFADFERDRRRRGEPEQIRLAADAPLRREWAVVCAAPDAAACVVGFERPPAPGEPRRFEAVWSVEPAVVHVAAELGVALAGRDAATVPPTTGSDAAATLQRAAAVTSRAISYLDA